MSRGWNDARLIIFPLTLAQTRLLRPEYLCVGLPVDEPINADAGVFLFLILVTATMFIVGLL